MMDNMMTSPQVALIIPSLHGDVAPLLESVRRQTLQPAEIEVVRGVRPNGRARNQGVASTSAPILVFVDDDAVLGGEHVIANLVASLLQDPTIGVTGASKLLPPDASRFQRWVAREVPRIVHPIVAEPLETNPDPPSFYCEITTTCCAMRRDVFAAAGGFDATLVRGVDTEFFVRVRRMPVEEQRTKNKEPRTAGDAAKKTQNSKLKTQNYESTITGDEVENTQDSKLKTQNYRLILVPHTWAYHPAPATFRALLRKHFLYGLGHAQEVRRDPQRARGRALRTPLHALAFVLIRTAILIPNIFLPYSFAAPSWRPGFKPLKALTSYVGALGYVWGWYTDDRHNEHE
jgi:hypothetical protein